MPQQNHLSLVIRKFIDQDTYLCLDLAVDNQLLDVVVTQLLAVEQVDLGIVIGYGVHLLFFPEVIDDQVVSNPYDPGQEPSIITVFPSPEGLDDLDKSFLKKIFSKLLILDGEQNVRIDFAAMLVNQGFNG